MAKENPQIGTCPCPFSGCTESMKVKRFAARSDNPLHTRKAGKLYADCPVHGRIGGDGSKAMQDYLLEKSDIWDPNEAEQHRTAAAQAAASASRLAAENAARQAPAKPANPPAPSPPPAKKRDLWDL
jgi:hypothetical protein